MSSFCTAKATHIFLAQHICISLDVNFNESLTNDVVSFEQLGPDGKVHEHSGYWENISADKVKYFLVFFFLFLLENML